MKRDYIGEPRILIKFYRPYKQLDSRVCTGSAIIKAGFAYKVERLPSKGLVLYHKARRILQPSDRALLDNAPIIALDAPWEIVIKRIESLSKTHLRHLNFRRLPSEFIPVNPFYKQKAPVFFTNLTRFSTAEAIASACFVLGMNQLGIKIIKSVPYAKDFLKKNRQVICKYF